MGPLLTAGAIVIYLVARKLARYIMMNPRINQTARTMEHLRYFGGVTKLREVQALYRELAKRLHPDNKVTGNAAWFMEMKDEYQAVTERIRKRRPVNSGAAPGNVGDAAAPEYSAAMPAPSKRANPQMETAIDHLADAARTVISTWLKSFLR